MKITIVHTRPVGGGAEKQMWDLVPMWMESADVTLMFLEDRELPKGDIPAGLEVISLEEPMPQGKLQKARWLAKAVWRLRRQLRSHDADVVLTLLWLPTVAVALTLPRNGRGRFVWSVQSDLEGSLGVHRDGWLRMAILRRITRRRVGTYIGISEGQTRRVRESLREPPRDFHVIHNSIDLTRVQTSSAEVGDVPPKEGLFRIITVARLHAQKGLGNLIDALEALRLRGVDGWECWLVGEGPDHTALVRQVERAGLSAQVHFAGFVSDPYPWLRSAEVFVLSSRWEPFGIAILEAMALSIPVVATKTDGALDIIDPDVDGLLVTIDEPIELAEALERLILNPEIGKGLAVAGEHKVLRFDAERSAAAYLELFEQLAPRSETPR